MIISSLLPIPVQTTLNLYFINDLTQKVSSVGTALIEELQDSFSSFNARSASTTVLVINNIALLASSKQRVLKTLVNIVAGTTLYISTFEKTREWKYWYQEMKESLDENAGLLQNRILELTASIASIGTERVAAKEQSESTIRDLQKQNDQMTESLSAFTTLLQKASSANDPLLLADNIRSILDSYEQPEQNSRSDLIKIIKDMTPDQMCLIHEIRSLRKEIEGMHQLITSLTSNSHKRLSSSSQLLLENT